MPVPTDQERNGGPLAGEWRLGRVSRARVVLCMAVVAGVAVGEVAEAQVPDEAAAREARTLFEQGNTLAEQQRWSEALEAFRRSLAIVARPSTRINIAMSLLRVGRAREALASFDEFLRTADPGRDAERITTAQRLRREAQEALATLVIEGVAEGTEVLVDGAHESGVGGGGRREVQLDPGTRRIELRGRNGASERFEVHLARASQVTHRAQGTAAVVVPAVVPTAATVTVAPATTTTAATVFRQPERARPVTSRPWFWVAVGGGVAVIATAVVLGVVLGSSSEDPYRGSTGVALHAIEGRSPQ